MTKKNTIAAHEAARIAAEAAQIARDVAQKAADTAQKVSEKAAETAEKVLLFAQDMKNIKDDISEIKRKLDNKYVTKEEFVVVRALVYGFASLVLIAFVGGLTYLIFK